MRKLDIEEKVKNEIKKTQNCTVELFEIKH